jgi:hypothetical protein
VGFCTPPGASFFGVRSLSLVFADLGTLLFSLFLLLISSSLSFVLRFVITSLFWSYHDSCQGIESSLKNYRYLGFNLQGVYAEIRYPKFMNSGQKQSERLRLD